MEIHIAKFLERFKLFGMAEHIFKEEVVKAVKDLLKTDITSKDIQLKNGDLIIQGSPFLKTELYMKKEMLLKKLDQAFLKKKIHNVR